MGQPDKELNDKLIAEAIYLAQKYVLNGESTPFLIQPDRHKLEYRPGLNSPSAERIPSITCIANFESGSPAKDSSATWSALTLVWFQKTFALPIEETVVKRIHELDWEALAFDFDP